MEFILASASPRRKELLMNIIKNFTIYNSKFDESSIIFNNNPNEYVEEIAKGKATSVYNNLEMKNDKIIIACDTIVLCNNEVLGKPHNNNDAFLMIKKLSGNKHYVFSGFAVYNTDTREIIKKSVCTEVIFKDLSDKEIYDYINKGESLDKAGAYGIQGSASIYIKSISGCYYNVVGLPLNALYETLMGMGVI